MSSETSRPPRARFRFGFSGSSERGKNGKVTSDEILESLTRQANLRERLAQERSISLDEIVQTEEAGRYLQMPERMSFPSTTNQERRSMGRFAFIVMLVGGFGILWIYGILSRAFDMIMPSRIQNLISITAFIDPTKVFVIGLFALIAGLLVRRARKRTNLRLLITS